ncbi:MAG: cardiolipin synthase ClsB, partial [Candidatus Accumulibacter sp.]|nr:cardiolipin synthase ClsB [Accumulibacter sp.]
MAAAKFLPGNRLTLLNSGADYFPALIAAIDDAQHVVHLETYIFEDDQTGRAVAEAMIRAARRGVTVRVLVDGFGAPEFAATLQPQLVTAGVQVMIYRPEVARLLLRRHRLRRLHRKLSHIDGRVAFVGGINVIDDCNTPHQIPPRYDYAVRIEGPLLQPIQY